MDPVWALLFGKSGGEDDDARRWRAQTFHWNDDKFPFVLQQDFGGPCGVLSVVQANVLRDLLFEQQEGVTNLNALMQQSTHVLNTALVRVLYAMIGHVKAAGSENESSLVHATDQGKLQPLDKIDLSLFTVLDFVATLVTSRGIEKVKAEMDDPETPLISRFGHCSQELMNLMLFGQATSNVFDGSQFICEGLSVRGVPEEVDIHVGLLSELEVLRYVSVSDRLKTPKYPFWIIGSTSHYTLVFSFDHTLAHVPELDQTEARIKRAFNLHALDDGIALAENVPKILQELGLTRNVFLESLYSEGILLYSDFSSWALKELSGASAASSPPRKRQQQAPSDMYFVDGQNPPSMYHVSLGEQSPTSRPETEPLKRILLTKWSDAKMRITPVTLV